MRKAFTLIELLIVVAIIAILAAIAVPNFLEAQVRSKISRAHADMRSIATGLESYRVDNSDYPVDSNWYSDVWGRPGFPEDSTIANQYPERYLTQLTTPIPYLTSLPDNPFPSVDYNLFRGTIQEHNYGWVSTDWIFTQTVFSFGRWDAAKKKWALETSGPDHVSSGGVWIAVFGPSAADDLVGGGFGSNSNGGGLYDPTNGTVSDGDICHAGP